MNIKFLSAIIGLSATIAVNSLFASNLSGEDEELQAALEASLRDYQQSHTNVDAFQDAYTLQVMHEEEEKRKELEAQERLVREFEEKRDRKEEEELQRILELSRQDYSVNNSGPSSSDTSSPETIIDEERDGESNLRIQQDLQYEVALLTDQLRPLAIELEEATEALQILNQPILDLKEQVEKAQEDATIARDHARIRGNVQGSQAINRAISAEKKVEELGEELSVLMESKLPEITELEEKITALDGSIASLKATLTEKQEQLSYYQ